MKKGKLTLAIIVLILFLLGLFNNNRLPKNKDKDEIQTNPNANNTVISPPHTKFKMCDYGGENTYVIPNMIAADVYSNFENKGFVIDKQIKNDHTSISCESRSSTEKLNIIITGCSPDEIISIEASAIDYTGGNQKVITDFFMYVVTIQYENSDSQKAKDWVKHNINIDGAQTTIGGVTFSISFKSMYSKFLRIQINHSEK